MTENLQLDTQFLNDLNLTSRLKLSRCASLFETYCIYTLSPKYASTKYHHQYIFIICCLRSSHFLQKLLFCWTVLKTQLSWPLNSRSSALKRQLKRLGRSTFVWLRVEKRKREGSGRARAFVLAAWEESWAGPPESIPVLLSIVTSPDSRWKTPRTFVTSRLLYF